MRRSKIEWCDTTWEIVSGCTKVSAGCTNCFAERMFPRVHGGETVGEEVRGGWAGRPCRLISEPRPRKFSDVRLHEDRLGVPLRWRKPRKVFVCSRSDLFHEEVPEDFIAQAWAVMAANPAHTFQVLTKRPERMCDFVRRWCVVLPAKGGGDYEQRSHLPNVQLGTSVENQEAADERIPHLLRCPAALRFLSLEPLLGPVDLDSRLRCPSCGYGPADQRTHGDHRLCDGAIPPEIGWVIVGGESGPNARPMGIDWARSIVEHCRAAGVACFVKQDSGPRAGQQGRLPDDLWAMKEFPS